MGLLYYSLVYMHRARVAVCLGSGGGFVPRVMRQAQRDLGMGDLSRTILVDANLPEAGWGSPHWLDKRSFFRTQFDDVEIVLATTQAAVSEFFAPQALHIDYLHIDADHSFDACLTDFESYRPFLAENSFVTLHDSNSEVTGVRRVVEHLRKRPDCEVIDFPTQGEGTALLRIRENIVKTGTKIFGHPGDAVTVTRLSFPPPTLPTLGWKYLDSPAFRTRGMIAAHFVHDCPTIIELGGGKSSIDQFLGRTGGGVIVVDPLIRDARRLPGFADEREVWHVRGRFQDVQMNIQRPGDYGLVLLGLELHDMSEANYRDLFDLVNGARATVIEFSPSFRQAAEQFDRICANTRTRERFLCRLDLRENEFGDVDSGWPPRCDREIHVLEPIASPAERRSEERACVAESSSEDQSYWLGETDRMPSKNGAKVEDLEAALRETMFAFADVRGQLSAVRGSTSWRVTAPLRWLGRMIRIP